MRQGEGLWAVVRVVRSNREGCFGSDYLRFELELELGRELGRELDWCFNTGLGVVGGVVGNEKVGCLN
jgi:hypothetical protein